MKRAILYTDAVIHTMRSESDTARSMLVENGRITALDVDEAAGARVLSLGGRHVYPCLIDGHVHLLYTVVLSGSGFDLCRIENGAITPRDMAGVKARLEAFAESKRKNALLVANNFIPSAIEERRMPCREELDRWCGGRPVVVYTIDGHQSALSSAMLRKLGISPDGHSGILSGEAHERVQGRITDIIAASVTPSVLARGAANFQNDCAGYGISCVGALDGNGDSKRDITTRLITALARRFAVDVRFYYQYMDIDKAEPLARFQRRRRIGGCGDWEMDGSIGAHTAAFSLPYKDTGEQAACYYDRQLVEQRVEEAERRGYQIASHAIGDLAIDRIVAALGKCSGLIRHRIEHCEFASDSAIEEIARRGWAVMAQPGYSWLDKRYLHTYEQHLPPELIARLKFKTYLDKGIAICGSTDSPVQALDPWLQMLGMVEFYNEEESVSVYDALRCYTVNPARAMLEEEERGMLLPGMRADFFTAKRDILSFTPEELAGFRPEKTYYLGEEYKKRSGSTAALAACFLKKPKKV